MHSHKDQEKRSVGHTNMCPFIYKGLFPRNIFSVKIGYLDNGDRLKYAEPL